MSSPLSTSILVHTAALYSYSNTDEYNNATYGSAVTLTRVRVSPAKKNELTALGEKNNDALVLIYDNANSLPKGTTFKALDKIVYGGKNYIVREVDEPSGDAASIHFYRVRLVTDGS
jgi:hypothetical protein